MKHRKVTSCKLSNDMESLYREEGLCVCVYYVYVAQKNSQAREMECILLEVIIMSLQEAM